MRVLKFIYKNLDHFKTRFLLVFIVGIFNGLATFFIPVLLSEFTRKEFTLFNFQRLIFYILIFYLLSLFFDWVIRKYGESLGPQYSNHIRVKYFKALENLPLRDLIKHHSGYVLSLINTASDGLAPIIFDIFWTYARSISTLSLFFYFTARESVRVALLNLFVLSLFVAISTYLSRKMVPIANELNRKRASLLEHYTDFMANILTVKRLGIYSYVEEMIFKKTADNYRQIQKLLTFHANRWFFLHFLYGVAFLTTVGFLLLQVTKGNISAAVLILFIAAYGTVRGNIERLSENFKELIELRAYLGSLNRITKPSKISTGGGAKIKTWKEINFKDVEFHYTGSSKKFMIPEFFLKRGEKICIVGKSGQGKTTFLNLLANFLTPQKGKRVVDKVPYKRIDKEFFQKKFAFISQDVELFNLPLRENITLGRKVGDKEIFQILEKVDLSTMVKNLKGGLNAPVGEKGIRLSTGQKQRINLVRGVILGREILILDEPTSHLDSTTERTVIEFLKKYLSEKTSIIVSHNSTLQGLCDKTYVISNYKMMWLQKEI